MATSALGREGGREETCSTCLEKERASGADTHSGRPLRAQYGVGRWMRDAKRKRTDQVGRPSSRHWLRIATGKDRKGEDWDGTETRSLSSYNRAPTAFIILPGAVARGPSHHFLFDTDPPPAQLVIRVRHAADVSTYSGVVWVAVVVLLLEDNTSAGCQNQDGHSNEKEKKKEKKGNIPKRSWPPKTSDLLHRARLRGHSDHFGLRPPRPWLLSRAVLYSVHTME